MICLVPTVAFFVVNSDGVQNMITQRVAAMLSKELGNTVSMKNARLSLWGQVIIDDLLITDRRGDTALFSPELSARLSLMSLSSKSVKVRKVVLRQADIRLATDTVADELNIQFLVERLKSRDTTGTKPPLDLLIQNIELDDCKFSFDDPANVFDRPFGMDYSHIRVSHLSLYASGFRLNGPPDYGVRFRVRDLSCVEQSGIRVTSLSTDFFVNLKSMSFKNIIAQTAASVLNIDEVSFRFPSWEEFSDSFSSEVAIVAAVKPSQVDFCELAQFVPVFHQYDGGASVQGKITGTIDNLKGQRMDISAGTATRVKFDFDLKGLPDIRSTFIYFNVADLTTCPADIELIRTTHLKEGHVVLPPTMHRLTKIDFKGNFTGFFDDFVTYGTFTTNLGPVTTDLAIKPITASADTSFTFNGKMKTDNFQLGALLRDAAIGAVTMNGMVNGMAERGNVQADISGQIGHIFLKGYDYHDIALEGRVNNRAYDGKLSIDEPNIKMDFSGKVDLTNPSMPAFNFMANVERAKLYPLRLVQDTSAFTSFNISADFAGTNIDNINGELNLKNSLIRRKSREIEINELIIFTKAIRDTNRFILRSDILDAEISGQYQFLKLPESFQSLVKNYAPAWGPAEVKPENLSRNNFRFEAEFKNTDNLSNFFVDEFHVAKGTKLSGVYNPSAKDVHFTFDVPFMRIGNQRWRGFFVNGATDDTTFVMQVGAQAFRINENLSFENISLQAEARSDSIGTVLSWHNQDSTVNKGHINSHILFQRRPHHIVPVISLFSEPGEIVASNDHWSLSHEGVRLDSSAIAINNLCLRKGEQEINVSGVVSERESDKLLVGVHDLRLSVLNSSLRVKQLIFGGRADGDISFSHLYKVPVCVSELDIDSLSLNGGLFGSTHLSAAWDAAGRSVSVNAISQLDDALTLQAKGDYSLADTKLDFDLTVNRAPAGMFQPYLGSIFSGLKGWVSSRMTLTGTAEHPRLNGEVSLDKVEMMLDYTRTPYHFSGTAYVQDNVFLFKDLKIFDRKNNSGLLNGSIAAGDLNDLKLDVRVDFNRMEVLATTERDNSLFYGKASANGSVRIMGVPDNLTFDIKVRPLKNTQFNIPISSGEEASVTSFISFVDRTPRAQKQYSVRRRRTRTVTEGVSQNISVNMSVDVTPDAEVQLIFDSKIGDIMRARGSGNLHLTLSPSTFQLKGTYVVDEGDYLFTLGNVINKKFILEKGSTIFWNGDPLDASLNLNAKYIAKPPIADLMGATESGAKTVPVECILQITNRLTDPNIRFDLAMPNAQQEVRSFLASATSTDEEMSRQFLWLLMNNRFYVDPSNTEQESEKSFGSSGVGSMALSTAAEFMTNQLSHMLSQWSDKLDMAIIYHPGMGLEGQNIGTSISTEWVNFTADFEVGGMKMAESSSNVVGDVTFDVKLTPNGKLRFKLFNRSNEQYFIQAPYTQGIGILYREDFNRLRDLFFRKPEEK